MKKFTVKDFITYNNPCFSCGGQVTFKMGYEANHDGRSGLASYLRPTVTSQYTEIDLKISYTDAIKLYIFHKTNKILTNNQMGLTKYLNDHKLFLETSCSKCLTTVVSDYLNFHLISDKQFVAAVTLFFEKIMVTDSGSVYQITTYFSDKKSTLSIYKADQTTSLQPTIIEMPLLPKSKFKTKDHFLEKIKTYILFS